MRSARRVFLRLGAFALLLVTPALAEDRHHLDDAGITAALSARVLQYPDGAAQNFYTDGRTIYHVTTGISWGKWWVKVGKYCSKWPPSETPGCHEVKASGPDLRFTGSRSGVTIGRYVDLLGRSGLLKVKIFANGAFHAERSVARFERIERISGTAS